MNETYPPSQPSATNRQRNLILGVGAGLLFLLLCCCLIVLIVVFADPFKLNLLSRLRGGYDAPATAMPADTDLYMSVNLLNLRTEKAGQIIAAFAKQAQEADVKDMDSLIQEIDQSMLEDIGMSLTEDVLPWIGQYAGFGLMNFSMDEYGGVESAEWIAAVEARDAGAADKFLDKIGTKLAESTDSPVTEEKHQGVTIRQVDSDFESERVAFARSERLVLFGSSADSVRAAIDAQKNDSLAKQPSYQTMSKQLPGGRALTIYINGQQFQELIKELARSSGGALSTSVSLEGWREVLVSLSIVEAGLQLDTVTAIDLDGLSEAQKALMESPAVTAHADELFPGNTILFARGQRLDLAWKAYRQLVEESLGGGDLDEAMEMLQQQIGFNPDTDLFPHLDGEWAIGVMPSSDGLLAQSANIDLGFALLAETSNSGAMRRVMDGLRPVLEEQGATFQSSEAGGITFTEVSEPFSEGPIAAYCVSDRYLALGSSSKTLEGMFSGGQSLAKSARYSGVWQAFPKGMTPAVYVDLDGLMGILAETMGTPDETLQMLSPIQHIAFANRPMQNGVGKSTVIVFIRTD